MLVKKPKFIKKKLKQQWVPCMHSCKNSKHSTHLESSHDLALGAEFGISNVVLKHGIIITVFYCRRYHLLDHIQCSIVFSFRPCLFPHQRILPFPCTCLWCDIVCARVCMCMCVCLFLCSLELSWERKGTIFVIFFWLLLLTMIHVSECKL